jgi:hypothetical protein
VSQYEVQNRAFLLLAYGEPGNSLEFLLQLITQVVIVIEHPERLHPHTIKLVFLQHSQRLFREVAYLF